MREIVEANNYGIKTGQGFYKWNEQTKKDIDRKRRNLLISFLEEDKK